MDWTLENAFLRTNQGKLLENVMAFLCENSALEYWVIFYQQIHFCGVLFLQLYNSCEHILDDLPLNPSQLLATSYNCYSTFFIKWQDIRWRPIPHFTTLFNSLDSSVNFWPFETVDIFQIESQTLIKFVACPRAQFCDWLFAVHTTSHGTL